jgi:hypothetical protein
VKAGSVWRSIQSEMQVQFDATIDDYVDVVLRSVAGSKAVKAWRWQGSIVAGLLVGLSVFLILTGSIVRKLVAGGLAFLLVTVANLAYYKSSYRKRARKLIREQLGTEGPFRIRVELTESGITFEQQETRLIQEWSTFERYEETDDAIYFLKRDRSVMAVRKRAFESKASQDQFLEFARKHMGIEKS